MLKRFLIGGGLGVVVVAAFLLGSLNLGVAGAQTPPAATPATQATPADEAAAPAVQATAPTAQTDRQEAQATETAGQDNEAADQGNGAADANKDEQEPQISGSVQAPQEQEGQSEQDEANALAALATITADQAKQAALGQFQGATVSKVELDDENGFVVYSVKLTDANGQGQEVLVDAGNGKVLATEAAHGHEGNGAAEVSEAKD